MGNQFIAGLATASVLIIGLPIFIIGMTTILKYITKKEEVIEDEQIQN